MSTYRTSRADNGIVTHLYEVCGVMTIYADPLESIGETHRTLMKSLCRRPRLGGWCDDAALDRAYPPMEDGNLPGGLCPGCSKTVHDRTKPISDTPSLLDMLTQEATA